MGLGESQFQLQNQPQLRKRFPLPAAPWDRNRAGMVSKPPQKECRQCSPRSPWHVGGDLDKCSYEIKESPSFTKLDLTLGRLTSYVKLLYSALGVHYLISEGFIPSNVAGFHGPLLTPTTYTFFQDQPWCPTL